MSVFTRSDDSPSSSCSHLTLASLWGMPPHLRRTVKRYPGMCNGNDKDAKTVCNDGRGGSTYVLIVPSNGSDPLYTEWSKEGSVDGKPFSNPVLNSTGERVTDCHTLSTIAAIHYLGWTLWYHSRPLSLAILHLATTGNVHCVLMQHRSIVPCTNSGCPHKYIALIAG